jgi:hypothetical protein
VAELAELTRVTPVVVTTRGTRVSLTNTARVALPGATQELPSAGASARHVARAEAGERWISRLLRGGAMCSGGLFLASLALEALPPSEGLKGAIDLMRRGAASALLVTPVVRLVVAGTTLGIRGEWRYAVCAAGVLGLLALAVSAGLRA